MTKRRNQQEEAGGGGSEVLLHRKVRVASAMFPDEDFPFVFFFYLQSSVKVKKLRENTKVLPADRTDVKRTYNKDACETNQSAGFRTVLGSRAGFTFTFRRSRENGCRSRSPLM